MFVEVQASHHTPHFHAYYQEHPELVTDWNRLQTGHKALPIAPLA